MRETALSGNKDFTFETVLSSRINMELLKKAKERGYRIEVIYVLTADVEINVRRVKSRVANGGHSVPEEKIRSRYKKSLANISELITLADRLVIVDNSDDDTEGKASIIVSKKNSELKVSKSKHWSEEMIYKLIFGK